MMADVTWLANEAKIIHAYFESLFYLLVTVLLLVGVVTEYFKLPIGGTPAFGQMVGRALIAAVLLHAYPEITNAIADVADSVAAHLGDLNDFKLVLDRMGDKVGELSWSWVSFKDSVMMIISFLTFFVLYFSVYVSDAFYLYAWTILYIMSPILIALYVVPVTAPATSALFRSLFEVASWKIVWSVIATLLWSSALSNIDQQGTHVSFLTAICFNIILAGSLLLTPFLVHALAGAGVAGMTKNLGALAIGGLAFSPGTAMKAGKAVAKKSHTFGKASGTFAAEKYADAKQKFRSHKLRKKHAQKQTVKRAPSAQTELDV